MIIISTTEEKTKYQSEMVLLNTLLPVLGILSLLSGVSSKELLRDTDLEELQKCKPSLTKHVIEIPGCKPKTVFNMECSGFCKSLWKTFVQPGTVNENYCSACMPGKKYEKIFFIECLNGKPSIPVTMLMSETCQCRKIPCNSGNIVVEDNKLT